MTLKWLRLTLSAAVVVAVGAWTLVQFGSREVARLTQHASQLEAEKRQLHEHIQRLGASHRVAQIDVIDQHTTEAGQTLTRLRWQETQSDGPLSAPIAAEIIGSQLYVEALVIKFEPDLVAKGDARHGKSITIFRRLFGEQQSPQSGYRLTKLDNPTDSVRSEWPHADIWKAFWKLVDDPLLAKRYDVRVAQCEAPAVPVKPGQTWEVSLDAVGGLNLRKIRVEKSRRAETATPMAQQ